MVVDDDEDTAMLFAQMLSERGFCAIALTTAAACIERAARGDIDVVIADIMLRETSGIALCRSLRLSHPGVCVLLITGQLAARHAADADAAGAFAYLTKPIEIDDLERAVTHALQVLAG